MTPFQSKVYEAVKKIPKGMVFTYKDVAEMIGSPGAYRAVGTALKNNTDPGVPCHRVIKSNGDVGEYNGLAGRKMALLKSEGAL
ncbi:MGMT family protein [Candidatus Parcubacteria bacterium]|nr:MGMT family protein [Candidatus Parcubacteria bacterium]